jgi:hypothetical protein
MCNIWVSIICQKDPERRNLWQKETRTSKKMLDNRHGGEPEEDEHPKSQSEDPRSTVV